jgi:DNA-binding HxlR family transcriptional regulator
MKKVACDVMDARCPSREVLDRIADKWTALVIYALVDGRQRNSQLLRRIGGISQKMLTQTLRDLERDGLVERIVYPVVPPHVEYRLTPLGQSLQEPLAAICRWAESHLPRMLAARARSEKRRIEVA